MAKDSDFEMRRSDPPARRLTGEDNERLTANIAKVRKKADGDWHLIARFDHLRRAANKIRTLKKRPEYQLFGFKCARLYPEDDLSEEGRFGGGLWCRWIGKQGDGSGGVRASDPPRLAVVKTDDEKSRRKA